VSLLYHISLLLTDLFRRRKATKVYIIWDKYEFVEEGEPTNDRKGKRKAEEVISDTEVDSATYDSNDDSDIQEVVQKEIVEQDHKSDKSCSPFVSGFEADISKAMLERIEKAKTASHLDIDDEADKASSRQSSPLSDVPEDIITAVSTTEDGLFVTDSKSHRSSISSDQNLNTKSHITPGQAHRAKKRRLITYGRMSTRYRP
jgi:hypothetical protein